MKEFQHYLKQLYSYSGNIIFINLLGMVVVSLLDGLAVLLLLPMLSVSGILPFTSGNSPIFSVLNFLHLVPSSLVLPLILCIYIFLTVGQNVLQRNLSIRDVKIHQGYINSLKELMYKYLLYTKWEFYLKAKKSYVINSLTKDMDRVSMGLKLFMQLAANSIYTIIQVAIAFWLSPGISVIVIVCGGGLALFSWRFVKQSQTLGKETTYLSREYLAGVTDNLNAIKDIKTNMLETSRLAWMKKVNHKILNEQVRFVTIQTNSQLSYKTMMALILSGFVLFTVYLIPTEPERLILVILIFGRLWPRFVTIQANLQQLALMIPAYKVVLGLQQEVRTYTEKENDHNGKMFRLEKAIEFRHVFFRYNTQNEAYTLEDISFQIPTNQTTAIIGHSGAGKSTLLDLLMGLSIPERGEIFLDHFTLKNNELSILRRKTGFVPQDPFLFNASIRENLLIMAPNATNEEIWDALEFASMKELIRSLPDGLNTIIGDRGVRLSGGERQRLVLARAILRKPSILILDEATSALDTETEANIQKALEKLKGKMTIIVIAHRLSTISHSDQVIVLEKGRVIQQGNYSRLALEKEGMLFKLLNKQIATVG